VSLGGGGGLLGPVEDRILQESLTLCMWPDSEPRKPPQTKT
jgi:hypothetical protein